MMAGRLTCTNIFQQNHQTLNKAQQQYTPPIKDIPHAQIESILDENIIGF